MATINLNKNLKNKLEGIQGALKELHKSGALGSDHTKGKEREAFINIFLSKVFPSPYRFGSGDITDTSGKISGQIDIAVEYPFLQYSGTFC